MFKTTLQAHANIFHQISGHLKTQQVTQVESALTVASDELS